MKRSVSGIIISTFLLAIAIGTSVLMLMLPFSTVSGTIAFEDALFTSASAVTVTGLIVKNTATYFINRNA
jgi:trk system potassium uptake protein TrkH